MNSLSSNSVSSHPVSEKHPETSEGPKKTSSLFHFKKKKKATIPRGEPRPDVSGEMPQPSAFSSNPTPALTSELKEKFSAKAEEKKEGRGKGMQRSLSATKDMGRKLLNQPQLPSFLPIASPLPPSTPRPLAKSPEAKNPEQSPTRATSNRSLLESTGPFSKMTVSEVANAFFAAASAFKKAAEEAMQENEMYELSSEAPENSELRLKQLVHDKVGQTTIEALEYVSALLREGRNRPRSLSMRNMTNVTQYMQQHTKTSGERSLTFEEAFKRDLQSEGQTSLQVAIKALKHISIAFEKEVSDPQNQSVLLQFGAPSASIYHYLQSLAELAHAFASIGPDLVKKDSKDPIQHFAYLFIKEIKHAKDIQELKESSSLKKEALAKRCREMAGCIGNYRSELYNLYKDHYHALKGTSPTVMKDTISALLLFKPVTTFQNDMKRAIYGNFLTLASDRHEPPKNDFTGKKESLIPRESAQSYVLKLMPFFIDNLQIDQENEKIKQILAQLSAPLEEAGEGVFDILGRIFDELNGELNTCIGNALSEGYMPGTSKQESDVITRSAIQAAFIQSPHLKLIPLLRAFNQVLLLEIHARLFYLHRSWINGTAHDKLAREITTATADNETKHMHVEFKNGQVCVFIKRLAHLEDHPDCLLQSSLILKSSIDDLSHWTVEPRLFIKKPVNPHPDFEKKYEELLFTLKVMELPYYELPTEAHLELK